MFVYVLLSTEICKFGVKTKIKQKIKMWSGAETYTYIHNIHTKPGPIGYKIPVVAEKWKFVIKTTHTVAILQQNRACWKVKGGFTLGSCIAWERWKMAFFGINYWKSKGFAVLKQPSRRLPLRSWQRGCIVPVSADSCYNISSCNIVVIREFFCSILHKGPGKLLEGIRWAYTWYIL